ncbi:glycosyl hydrolase family 18 protein [Paenibacillus thailandensis]|uniref:Glycosyl hydrolase family 18 protein n=1 Tax=Paenibacillus thailandensis TaxID=393250 RepID=A0ABW5QYR7_9BACL
MYTRIRPRRKRRRAGRHFFVFFLLGLFAVVGWYIYLNYIPNNKIVKPDYPFKHTIMVEGQAAAEGATLRNGEILLPVDVLNEALGPDKPIYYEPDTGSIVMTTSDKVLRLRTESLTATINSKPYQLTVAAEVEDGIVYVPATPLKELYGIDAEYAEQTGIVTLLRAGKAIQLAETKSEEGASIRLGASIREPIVEQVPAGGVIRVWDSGNGWLFVQGPSGNPGYIASKDVTLTAEDVPEEPESNDSFVPWDAKDGPINLTWEAVYNRNPDPAGIPKMEGVNVVSPTWFELQDGKGTVKGKADPAYVRWAHSQGMQVWAVFSNGFEPERTTKALASADTRFYMIQQLVAFAELYKLQGINIDFENVHTSDKQNLVQFVKELTPLLHEQGLVVSIDVTPKSTSEMWSLFLDRAALGKTVDYMMLMAYDEHWASSPTAGSVASLGWTEQSLLRILEEDGVPPEKLILGMPLYTRIWTETKDESGAVKVTSKAVGMEQVRSIIAEKKLKPAYDADSGQNYVEYKEGNALNRIWIEDEVSIKARVALARKYGLAGVATWQRGFQADDIWKTIQEALQGQTK